MTTQLPPRERSQTEVRPDSGQPEVLFEEARRRRRRRWTFGASLTAVAVAGLLTLGMAGGGGGGAGDKAHGQPFQPASGAGPGHTSAGRLFAGAPASGGSYTGPGAECALAPHSRYLPPWSGCVSAMVANVSGNGSRDLILAYSRLSHVSVGGLPPRTIGRRGIARYLALQAMLRVVTPGGRTTTIPIRYMTTPFKNHPAQMVRAGAAVLISLAHVGDGPGKTIFLQTGQLSSGSLALAYTLYRGRLVSSGAVLGFGGDAGSQAGFQCVAGNPPQLIQRTYDLMRGIRSIGDTVHIYGWWKVTTTRYGWDGPRLVTLAQNTANRRLLPSDTVGRGCIRGVA